MAELKKIPVILDTDLGDDIDDTWAIAMMLNCPELEVRLIVSATGDTVYRAKLIAKLLEQAGRTDIPVGIGVRQTQSVLADTRQGAWVQDYDLASYPGTLCEDGVQATIDLINASDETMTLISIGPTPNIAALLERDSAVAPKVNFVGMHGSVYKGYAGDPAISAEYNVAVDIPSCQATFTAPWKSMTITPVDTCGVVQLKGELYQQIRVSTNPMLQAVMENYRLWDDAGKTSGSREGCSSILFDTVAIHLAYSTEFLQMKEIGIRVDDKGYTLPDGQARLVNVAVEWDDLDAFHAELANRLLG